jgi:hypothetical protein
VYDGNGRRRGRTGPQGPGILGREAAGGGRAAGRDAAKLRDEARKRERAEIDRKVAAERTRRDAAHGKKVYEERERKSEAWRKSQEPAPAPETPRPIPLDAIGRRKAAAAGPPPVALSRGVRPSRLIQSLGQGQRKPKA